VQLNNIVLDKLDQELERRGHRFVRYADYCSIYVRSERSGDVSSRLSGCNSLLAKLRPDFASDFFQFLAHAALKST
jgi:retron-type reverse transcriptase